MISNGQLNTSLCLHPRPINVVVYNNSDWETLSCRMFHTYMLSAFITSKRGYPAVPLAEQLVHYWLVQLGPLVLKSGLLKFPNAHSR